MSSRNPWIKQEEDGSRKRYEDFFKGKRVQSSPEPSVEATDSYEKLFLGDSKIGEEIRLKEKPEQARDQTKPLPQEELVSKVVPEKKTSIPRTLEINGILVRPEEAEFPRKLNKAFKKYTFQLSALATGVAFVSSKSRSFYISSAYGKEGKTTSALFLARALATHIGAKTLLVDGHISSPKIHTLLGVPLEPGFLECLKGRVKPETAILRSRYPNLYVLTRGKAYNSIADISSESIELFINQMLAYFDHIIFDGGSIMTSSDPVVMASSFDGVILVIECERTRWEVIQLVREKMESVGIPITGVILNKRKYYVPDWLYSKL